MPIIKAKQVFIIGIPIASYNVYDCFSFLLGGIMFKSNTLLLLQIIVSRSAIPDADTVTNSIGMKFKRIPAGTFEMGNDLR